MYQVVANVITDKALRTGAKVGVGYLLDPAHAWVRGISKGGRTICKVIAVKKLTNFRAAFAHAPEWHAVTWGKREDAQAFADRLASNWSDVRILKPDGTLVRDGISNMAACLRLRDAAMDGEG